MRASRTGNSSKYASPTFITVFYLKFWSRVLNSKLVPKDILEKVLEGEFLALKHSSRLSSRALRWVSDGALTKVSSFFLSCSPLRKLCPIIVNLAFFLDRMIEYSIALSTPVDSGGFLLDIGSGYSLLPSYLGLHSFTVSLDVNKTALIFQKMASKTMGKCIFEKVDCICADSTRPPFMEESFDRIFVVSTIEHIDRDYLVAKESGRILRKNGHCFMSFPFSEKQIRPQTKPYFQRSYTKEMIEARLVIPSLLSSGRFSTVFKSRFIRLCNMVPGWFVLKDLFLYSTMFKLDVDLHEHKEGTLALLELVKLK